MKSIVAVLSFASLLSTASYAEDGVGFGARVSTLGVGGEFAFPMSERLNLRVGLYGLSHSREESADNIDYDIKANLLNAGALMDYYPWAGKFHFSTGIIYSGNKVAADALQGQNFEIGSHIYTPEEVGTVHGVVKANKIAPYAGIGWGKTTSGEGKVKFLFDAGVMMHGTPKVNLTTDIPASSPLNLDPSLLAEFNADLDQEVASFQNDISAYKFFPVISFGIGFKF